MRMINICTRACIGTFYGPSAKGKTKLTFQIHAKDRVRFLKRAGGVVVGQLYRDKQKVYFSVPRDTAKNNFGRL